VLRGEDASEHFSLCAREVMCAQKYSAAVFRGKRVKEEALKTGVHHCQNIGHNIILSLAS